MNTSWGNKKVENGTNSVVQPAPRVQFVPEGQPDGQANLAQPGKKKRTPKMKQPKQPKDVDQRKVIIVLVIILGVLAVAGLIWFLVVNLINQNPNNPEIMTPEVEDVRNEENGEIFQDVYDEAKKEDSQEKADEVFQEAIDAAGNNSGAASAVQVSQLRYWLENGEYDKITEIVQSPEGEDLDSDGYAICENPALGLDLRISCHNIVGLAYGYIDEIEDSNYHMARMRELMDERTRLFYEQN